MLILIYKPYLDIFRDYRDQLHIILWYDWCGNRKYINLLGG